MPQRKIHKPALAIYSIIVGLAIKEALTAVVPHIIAPPAEPKGDIRGDVCRLITFLIVIIRFYLDSIFYFEWAYLEEQTSKKFKKKNYTLDFLLGIGHFILFSVWSFTVDTHTNPPFYFFICLAVILLTDFLRWALAYWKGYDTDRLMRFWMLINLGTLVVGAAFYFGLLLLGVEQFYVELAVFVIVVSMSLVDTMDMINEGKSFEGKMDWFDRFK